MKLAHVCIKARDLDQTERFYVDLLGCEATFRFVREGRRIGLYLRAGDGTFIEAFEDPQMAPRAGAILHLCFETPDIDAQRDRLLEHGIAVSEKTLGADNSYQAWLKDPSGIDIELHEYTETSAQRTGAEVEL